MKKLILIIAMFITSAHGYEICGPSVDGADISYTPVAGTELIGHWVIGSGCVGQSDDTNVLNLCSNPIVTGQAFCSGSTWGSNNLDETTAGTNGGYCWCRRTKMMANGQLVDSIGQWVLIGNTQNNVTTCRASCAEMCADSVANNPNNMRNPIMVLSAF